MEFELGVQSAPMALSERFLALAQDIARATRAAGRSNVGVTVVAVSKRQPREQVLEAIQAGVTDIGENYYQEAVKKFVHLPPVRKHFLGRVQTNKARGIVAQFDMVQSVDRIEAGRALARAARDSGKRLPVLVQVNISPTERSGVTPKTADRLAEELRDEGLLVDGVMAIGPVTQDQGEIQRAFSLAAGAFSRVGGKTLSLGMSDDWREAVACGSTMIRIGTALFGKRSKHPIREALI
ncbi:MAG: YggS family pyridoxal phosphate-dependent enzyme [Candidatus Eremiobacteraeota bacterium]|nr:YggS family pyridoxal phosphate-dependent enzyme [Candidatus Eremiobacteraeota bacterium]MDQ6933021.1 YggS family pyridoxal phosphate-dependent enzyme [Candidatus Eremiobacteraeota bacterium]